MAGVGRGASGEGRSLGETLGRGLSCERIPRAGATCEPKP